MQGRVGPESTSGSSEGGTNHRGRRARVTAEDFSLECAMGLYGLEHMEVSLSTLGALQRASLGALERHYNLTCELSGGRGALIVLPPSFFHFTTSGVQWGHFWPFDIQKLQMVCEFKQAGADVSPPSN